MERKCCLNHHHQSYHPQSSSTIIIIIYFFGCFVFCFFLSQFADGYTFLEGILSSFTTECQMELSRDPNNYVTSPDGKLMMKPEISTDICSVICLRHGRCNKGQCICDNGYEGDNCHLLAGVGPQLARIRGCVCLPLVTFSFTLFSSVKSLTCLSTC